MIHRSITNVVAVLLAGAFLSTASAAPTLKQQTEGASAEAKAAPDKAAVIVEKYVTETPEYACPIIKAVIDGGKLAKEETPDLIAAAIKAAPDKAPEIKACLPADWAGASGVGKEVVGKGVVGQGTVTPGSEGAESGADDGEMNGYRGVVGTYLAAPSGGGAVGTSSDAPTVVPSIVRVITPRVRVVREQTPAPATPSVP